MPTIRITVFRLRDDEPVCGHRVVLEFAGSGGHHVGQGRFSLSGKTLPARRAEAVPAQPRSLPECLGNA